jgi:RNA polymerase sigma-70 factor (ECF subfamily)
MARGGADLPDADLVGRVLDGDTEAFGPLVERYRAAFGRYAAAMCGDPDLAADALQEAFIRAFDGLARCDQPERFGAWFFRILTNQCRNHRTRWRKRNVGEPQVTVEAGAGADDGLLREEIRAVIQRAMDQLSAEQRAAFVLRHMDGRSYREMAELLGEREDTLRMRVHRARQHMRKFLEERS